MNKMNKKNQRRIRALKRLTENPIKAWQGIYKPYDQTRWEKEVEALKKRII
jgi:hypothetical protein